MKQIRRGIFETNSSSMHSISIYRKDFDGKIPRNRVLTIEDFEGIGGGKTELEKLEFCIKLLYSILDRDRDNYKLNDLHKKNTIDIINNILDFSCKSKIDFQKPEFSVQIRHFSDMYSGKSPLEIFKEFVKNDLGKDIGDDILEVENLMTVVIALTKIIFSPDIITIDESIC